MMYHGGCVSASGSAVALHTAVRAYSEVRNNYSGRPSSPWAAPGEAPSYPSVRSPFPLPQPRFRKTHIEWMLHHGHGDRYGKYGPSREIADFEYADGTPSSISSRRFAYKHHQDHLLVQLIRAGATVERFEEEELLPRIPGTPEQRDWDPEVPLFLEDLDEAGRPPRAMSPDMMARVMEERFTSDTGRTPVNLANKHAGESLEPNTMFATFDPAAFVSDAVRMDERKPFWSRRRWALNDNFMVPMSPKPKNTIPDE
ncbi:putative mitochondrial hypothetical protein [Leptomonas pyrrhocoris]|uniref:Uncharacterized protein n=1 Tax=Leptomonas pyrrhocoris TaxID=157538 RepID=A0A0N0DSU2_LEPPY|nr:putative mitochondrial hypothetical protein [Leptomonas pyrrhocoris]KPA76562.1 putative mitochondrial hypothetical protein [Leptomonas pyrrhocoris]|eukprot:XP_015655001.1 putative mitochondrial hypothetical protein [Leptomonas pyrrhocoris]